MDYGPDERCAGEAADAVFVAGDFEAAHAAYAALWANVKATRKLDAFIVSKIVLGMLLCKVSTGEHQQAHTLWTMQMGDAGGLGIGIYGLENGQVDTRDAAIYLMVS